MATRTSVKAIFYFFILLVTLIGIVLVLEITVRLRGHYPLNGIAYSKTEIWRWRAWASTPATNEEGEHFVVHTDKYGFRNYGKKVRKAAGVIRVLVLGDSFTEGLSYADDEIFTALLEKNLAGIKKDGKRIEVIGGSSPAWSTEQELRCLQNEAQDFEPDYVLLMATPNDIREAYCKRFVVLTDVGTIKFNPINYRRRETIGWRLSTVSHFYQYLQKNVFHTDYGTFDNLTRYYKFNFGKEDSALWDRPVYLKHGFAEQDTAYRLFFTLIGEINKTCQKKKISLAVSLIPTVEEFNGVMDEDTTMQSGLISARLKQYCDSMKLDYVDLYTRFKNDSVPTSHFLKSDFHFNGKGHRVTAEVLADYYRKKL